MKKTKLLIALLTTLCLLMLTFAGCKQTDDSTKSITIIIGTTSHTIETTSSNLHEVLLAMKDDGTITKLTLLGGDLMPYISEIEDQKEDYATDGTYVAVFHDINDATLISYSMSDKKAITKEHNSKVYFFSNCGIKELPIKDGATYYIVATNENLF